MVLAANGAGGVATLALRPSGIFGERDPLLVPLTVAKARQGKMKYVIGSGANLMDFTYVGNVAQAHVLVRSLSFSWSGSGYVAPALHFSSVLCPLSSSVSSRSDSSMPLCARADALGVAAQAAEALARDAKVAGRAYFITNAEPRRFWTFLGDFLEPLGYARPSKRLPWQLVYALAYVFEFLTWLLRPFVVRAAACRVKHGVCLRACHSDLKAVVRQLAQAASLAGTAMVRRRPGGRR